MTESRSESLFKKALSLMPGGVSSPVRGYDPFPRFFEYGEGAWIRDVDGKECIDYCMGFGSLILGHSDERVVKRVKEQLERGILLGSCNQLELELSERMVNRYPGIEMVRFTNSGTEATMTAIRLARGYSSKRDVVKIDGGYHGAHDSMLIRAGSGAQTYGFPDSKGVLSELAEHTLVVGFNDAERLERCLKENEDIACLIIEPVMGNMGVIPPEKGYLERARELCDEHDVLLIFDEIITGYRLGLGGAQELFHVVPDVTTLGKIAGGGFPIGAVGGKREIMEELSPAGKVYQAGTFSGHPITLAAGLATIDVMEKEGYRALDTIAGELINGMSEIAEGKKMTINKVRSMFTLFIGVDRVSNGTEARRSDSVAYMRLHRALLQSGIYFSPSQFESCFLSLAHGREEIEKTLEAFEDALRRSLIDEA
jgi:glutamate-1-semialdehyde 2,1-aminomutase